MTSAFGGKDGKKPFTVLSSDSFGLFEVFQEVLHSLSHDIKDPGMRRIIYLSIKYLSIKYLRYPGKVNQ